MTVEEYLVKRILDLETDIKRFRNESAGAKAQVQMLNEDIKDLSEQLDCYEMEKEHIKQIITCNIEPREVCFIDLSSEDDDFKTLLAILDIKPDDYEIHTCSTCKHMGDFTDDSYCVDCTDGEDKWERWTEDAETKD